MEHAQRASLQHRLKRRELWVSLWLTRLLGLLERVCGEPHSDKCGVWRTFIDCALTALSKAVMCIFLCHANLRITLRKARGFNDPRQRNVFGMRAIFGAALRRRFEAKTFAGRIAKIRRALENSERLIVRLAKRLRRGMTRRTFAHTRAPIGADAVFAMMLCAAAIPGADTS